MGLLDDLMQSLSGAEEAIHPRVAEALQGLFRGDPAQPGLGLEGLLQRLQQAGFGGIVQSWLGAGTNLPVAPDQLRSAIGEADVQEMASEAGMAPDDWLAALAEHLPNLIHRLSPGGTLLPAGAGTAITL